MKRRSSYKVTFFDRQGPAGEHRMKAVGLGLMVGFMSLPLFYLVGVKMGLTGAPLLAAGPVGGLILGGFSTYFSLRLGQAAGDAAEYFTAGGSSTPYEEQFSQEQALIMQRDYAGAAACFEQRIAMNARQPDIRVFLAAADLYRTLAENPVRSAELYRQAQKLPALTGGQDVYVANKLADLYLGPLKQPGKALVEFRRLIERYPNSRTAEQARMALSNVKQGILEEQGN